MRRCGAGIREDVERREREDSVNCRLSCRKEGGELFCERSGGRGVVQCRRDTVSSDSQLSM